MSRQNIEIIYSVPQVKMRGEMLSMGRPGARI